jgi:hypothetical protein
MTALDVVEIGGGQAGPGDLLALDRACLDLLLRPSWSTATASAGTPRPRLGQRPHA